MTDKAVPTEPDALSALMDDDARLDQLAREAVQDALQEHKRNGQSVVVWQDGKIVTLLPGEIPSPCLKRNHGVETPC